MTSDWKQTLKRIAIATGNGLLLLSKHLLALLAAIATFIVLRAIPAIWAGLRNTVFPALHRLYLRLPHRRIVAASTAGVVAIAIAVLLMRTPGVGPDGAATPTGPAVLTFTPAEAAPGAPIVLSGLPPMENELFEVTVGGQPAVAQRLPDGSIRTLVPLYLGPDNWPVPPDGAQKLEVLRDGQAIAVSRDGLRVTELQRAPGTTAGVQRSLEKVADGYERIFESLPVQRKEEMAYRRAVVAALRGLASKGDKSLAAVLAGTSPLLNGETPDLELTDALLASSGAANYLDAYGTAMAGETTAANPPRAAVAGAGFPYVRSSAGIGMPGFALAPTTAGATCAAGATSSVGPQCRGQGKDFEIACLMQVQGLLTDFSLGFVKPTADTYANTVGLLISGASAAGAAAIPAHVIVSALLSVANVVMEKIAPSLFPAQLSQFEMRVGKSLIDIDETIQATITVAARNNPQTITFLDLLDVVKSVLGPAVKFPTEHQNRLKDIFEFTLDIFLLALKESGVAASIDPGVFTMPPRSWGPTKVTSDDLVSLFSYEPQVVSAQEKELSWRGERSGQSTVRVMPRGPGERSKVLEDNTLCPGCVWSGGAFGTDMPASSEQISVGLKFNAHPVHGDAPLRVRFTWDLLLPKDAPPVACILDLGDGSPVERFANCIDTDSFTYTYPYTSRLNAATGGAYVATLSRERSNIRATAEVFPDWEFDRTPENGKTPLDAKFYWDIPWPTDKQAPSCEFDPGDGSPRQKFGDCIATRKTEHRFERRGSFVPTLTVIHGSAKDTKTAPVSVADDVACEGLLKHKTWTGAVSYRQQRDAWDKRGYRNVKYNMTVNLGSELAERTRREHAGVEYLVQYYSPLPQGSASLQFKDTEYGGSGDLEAYETFTSSGGMQRQTPDMAEDGSMLTLTLNARSCTYEFHLQGQVMGSGEIWRRFGNKKESYRGYGKIHSVWGEGIVTSATSISGSAPFPVLSPSQIHDNGFEKTTWVSEYGNVSSALGESNLGKVTVQWHFVPKE